MEQHPGQSHSKTPCVYTRRVRFSRPGAGGGIVREGWHTPETRAGRLQLPQHFQTCERLPTQDLAACEPPETAGHSRRRAKGNPRRGIFLDTSSPKIMKKYHRSYSTCAHVRKKTLDFIALRVFSSIHAASLPQNVYYRVIVVHEGGGTPPRRVPPLRTCHHTTKHV